MKNLIATFIEFAEPSDKAWLAAVAYSILLMIATNTGAYWAVSILLVTLVYFVFLAVFRTNPKKDQ